ncbi:hypothetical protein [Streptomyces sp. NBC_00076]|uniref:hypothetical protein n=1 Tax=Streptomyces sp. NBC_00076 TaxID=2975642 RepID=UPI003255C006
MPSLCTWDGTRARLAVWPDLTSDIAAVLGALPTEGLIECVWQDEDGRLQSATVDEDEFPELATRISGASGCSTSSRVRR